MKLKLLIIAIICGMATKPGLANHILQVSTSSSLGTLCYTDSLTNDMRLKRCDCGNECDGVYIGLAIRNGSCPGSTDNPSSETECVVGTSGNSIYWCGTDANSNTCEDCLISGNYSYSTWTNIGSNRVRRNMTSYVSQSSGYACAVSSTAYSYGCDAGYYTKASTASASMTCERCPISGSTYGTSPVGNISITNCYLPKGSFSDEKGSGTTSGDCYWSN